MSTDWEAREWLRALKILLQHHWISCRPVDEPPEKTSVTAKSFHPVFEVTGLPPDVLRIVLDYLEAVWLVKPRLRGQEFARWTGVLMDPVYFADVTISVPPDEESVADFFKFGAGGEMAFHYDPWAIVQRGSRELAGHQSTDRVRALEYDGLCNLIMFILVQVRRGVLEPGLIHCSCGLMQLHQSVFIRKCSNILPQRMSTLLCDDYVKCMDFSPTLLGNCPAGPWDLAPNWIKNKHRRPAWGHGRH